MGSKCTVGGERKIHLLPPHDGESYPRVMSQLDPDFESSEGSGFGERRHHSHPHVFLTGVDHRKVSLNAHMNLGPQAGRWGKREVGRRASGKIPLPEIGWQVG